MLKALILDMDGVLINTEPLHYEADRLLFEELGYKLEYSYYEQFIGSTNAHLWRSIKEEFELSQSVEELCLLADQNKRKLLDENGYPIIEGVYEMIKCIYDSGLTMAVASSSPPVYIEEVTKALDIFPLFHFLVSGENVENPKPAPDVFLKAADLLEVDPSECVVVEDSSNGVKAAKAAGMVCIGFINKDSGNQDLSDADYLIEGYDCMDRQFIEMVYSHRTGSS